MSTQIQIIDQAAQMQSEFDKQQLETLYQAGVIPANTPPAQVALFAQVCRESKLSPFKKQIYLVGYFSKKTQEWKYSIITGIDGYREIAGRTGLWAGNEDPVFNADNNGKGLSLAQVIATGKLPITCRVVIYKLMGGQRVPFYSNIVFNEFAKQFNGQLVEKWAEMPYQMIMKVAEAFALRRAFPSELAGVAVEEELAAYEGNTVSAQEQKGPQLDYDLMKKEVNGCTTLEELKALFWGKYAGFQADEQVVAAFTEKQTLLKLAIPTSEDVKEQIMEEVERREMEEYYQSIFLGCTTVEELAKMLADNPDFAKDEMIARLAGERKAELLKKVA